MRKKKPCKKRTRKSSSDVEADQVKQARKRGKPATMEDGATAAVEATNGDGDGDGSVAELRLSLAGLMQGQEKLRELINTNFVRQSTNLAAMIDSRLANFRAEIDGHMRAMYDDLQAVHRRVEAIEQRPQALADNDLNLIYRRLDAVETGIVSARQPEIGQMPVLIVKGLQETTEENDDSIKQKCDQLIAQLEIQARILKATRIDPNGRRGQHPRPISMTLASIDDLKTVMRNKRKLKDIPQYSNVYIEPSRSAEVRNLEGNIRRLVKELPNLEYRRGRVVAKSHPATPHGAQSDTLPSTQRLTRSGSIVDRHERPVDQVPEGPQ